MVEFRNILRRLGLGFGLALVIFGLTLALAPQQAGAAFLAGFGGAVFGFSLPQVFLKPKADAR